jgi:hypothetical protein
MGSEAHEALSVDFSTGLIPRFLQALLQHLEGQDSVEFELSASFLEVYGEDICDLLDPHRPSLPLRKDSNGDIVCAGLVERPVPTVADALQTLHEGTMHRTTAATLMNLTSSRSHAVFTLTLIQTQKSNESMVTKSRLTFVDLAGSERLKKTGASGQQAKEGIQINQGLLALGNVIHALASKEDASRDKSGGNAPIHIPYRQSKLTRLLQEALGGNSQTLFLACVSPADCNASESLSTLHYANRARNIKNTPQVNIQGLELQLYQQWSRVLTAELVKAKFQHLLMDEVDHSPGILPQEILDHPDVVNYIKELQSVTLPTDGPSVAVTVKMDVLPSNMIDLSPIKTVASPFLPRDLPIPSNPDVSILDSYDNNFLTEVDPDAEMAILDQLLELQHKDQEFDREQQDGNEKIKKVDGELAEQEAMLLQLRHSLQVYHDMKGKYESLMAEVQQLEAEKLQLAERLQKALHDPTQGCSKAIQQELDRVERKLARTQGETAKHRQLYRQAEEQAQKCRNLEKQISQLKLGRAQLVKKQKEAAARHREYTEKKTRELRSLQRQKGLADHKVAKLQNELDKHKKNLDSRHAYINKLNAKLQQTESHLSKLLTVRQKQWRNRTSLAGPSRSRRSTILVPIQEAEENNTEETESLQFLLDQIIQDKVQQYNLEVKYNKLASEYSDAKRAFTVAMWELEHGNKSGDGAAELEQVVEDTLLQVELLGSKMQVLQDELSDAESKISEHCSVASLLSSKSAPVLANIAGDYIDRVVKTEVRVYI